MEDWGELFGCYTEYFTDFLHMNWLSDPFTNTNNMSPLFKLSSTMDKWLLFSILSLGFFVFIVRKWQWIQSLLSDAQQAR